MNKDLEQTVAGAVERKGGPVFYLDTNVLIDLVLPRRNEHSAAFLEECLARSWRSLTSTFALMEALDIEQTNRWAKNEMRKGKTFHQLRRYGDRELPPRVYRDVHKKMTIVLEDLVELFQPESNMWEDAIRIAIHTASFAPDCIHVAAARSRDCDILVTRDSQLMRAAKDEIMTAEPEHIMKWL